MKACVYIKGWRGRRGGLEYTLFSFLVLPQFSSPKQATLQPHTAKYSGKSGSLGTTDSGLTFLRLEVLRETNSDQ